MASTPPRPVRAHSSLSLKMGGWFEAHATGLGVVALPIVVLVIVAAGLAKAWLGL